MRDLSLHTNKQEWVTTAERIDCLAPLPEDPANALLTKMLTLAPYEVPEKKAKKKAAGTRKGLRCKVILDSSSDEFDAHSSHGNEEEEKSPPQPGETRKGRPTHPGRPKGPRREGPSFRTAPRRPPTATTSGYPGTSPWRSRKYPDTIVIHGMFYYTASHHAEHDYAVHPEPISTYLRRMVLWTRRI